MSINTLKTLLLTFLLSSFNFAQDDCDAGLDEFGICGGDGTLQGAIDATEPGGTVIVPGGTYNETITIDKILILTGSGSVTGGVVIAGWNVVIDGLSLSGRPSQKNTVIWVDGSAAPHSVTISNCVLDGESDGKYAFYGSNSITGDLIFDGNTIKNMSSWYVIDNTGSSDATTALDNVVFTNNTLSNVLGSIAFRGKQDDPMTSVTISGNTADYTGLSLSFWAFIEVDNAQHVEVAGNSIHGISDGGWGEGHAFQLWSKAGDWSVDIHDNDLSGNFQGIAIPANAGFYAPSGTIHNNNLSGSAEFGLSLDFFGPYDPENDAAPLDASMNYWGGNPGGDEWHFSDEPIAGVNVAPWYSDEVSGTLVLLDCAGVWDGDSWPSDCGCVAGDNSGDDCDDCANTPNGSASIDDCGVCSGGESGHTANSDIDDCDVCFGGNGDIDDFGLCFNNNLLQGAIDAASDGGTVIVPGGTYNETATINKSLTLTGSGSVTGGVVIASDDVTVDGLSLSGRPSQKNTVIWVDQSGGAVRNNITISNCVLDGESDGKYAFYGSNSITGDLTFDGNTIQNMSSWYVIDNTGSSDATNALDNVVFTNNTLSNVLGSIAFRGKQDDPMTSVTITGNTADYTGLSLSFWAFVEVNNAQHVEFAGNSIHGISDGGWGEGQAFQLWSKAGDWSVDIHDNDLSGNFQGIAIAANAGYYTPSGTIHNNNLSGSAEFGLSLDFFGPYDPENDAAPLDASINYWGGNPGDIAGANMGPWFADELGGILVELDCEGVWDGNAPTDCPQSSTELSTYYFSSSTLDGQSLTSADAIIALSPQSGAVVGYGMFENVGDGYTEIIIYGEMSEGFGTEGYMLAGDTPQLYISTDGGYPLRNDIIANYVADDGEILQEIPAFNSPQTHLDITLDLISDCGGVMGGTSVTSGLCGDCWGGHTGLELNYMDTDNDDVCNDGAANGDDDNCPDTPNTDQADNESDDIGDLCDDDDDNDGCNDDVDDEQMTFDDDYDSDGTPDDCDNDDDNDGAVDGEDSDDNNEFECNDDDGDSCDECSNGQYDSCDDGADNEGDCICDATDPDDDNDGCLDGEDKEEDGSDGSFAWDDDYDGDGTPDDCDADADNDGSHESVDSNDNDPFVCSDVENDTCDDCSSGSYDTFNDGPDDDNDGECDISDQDDDNDGCLDDVDEAPFTWHGNNDGDVFPDDCDDDDDNDGCLDDNDTEEDGSNAKFVWDDDYDSDGTPDDCDADADNDGSDESVDSDDNNEFACSDDDNDTCDDCSNGSHDTDSECNYNIDVNLDAGANLISFNALPDDVSVSSIFDGAYAVSSEGAAAVNIDNGTWIGSLTAVSQDEGYWVTVSSATALSLTDAEPISFDIDGEVEYNIHYGSNLISYPFQTNQDLNDALGDAADHVYAIITENAAALKVNGEFVGSLTDFEGGKGYWLISYDEFTFTFNGVEEGLTREVENHVQGKLPELYRLTQSSNQAFYFINSVSIQNKPLDSDDIIVAYNDNVIVGARYWNGEYTDIPVMGIDTYNAEGTSDYCAEGDKITFKVLIASSDELVDMDADTEVSWTNMGMSIVNLIDVLPLEVSLDNAYPNPFNPTTTLSYSVPVDMNVTLAVYDMRGRLVDELVNDVRGRGIHQVVWNADQYASGVYMVKMVTGSTIQLQKIMLLK